MQFSVNNKQSILNTCMVRSLIEVFLFSAGFLALCYFVIKCLDYGQDTSYPLSTRHVASPVINFSNNFHRAGLGEGQTDALSSSFLGTAVATGTGELPARLGLWAGSEESSCPGTGNEPGCIREKGFSVLVAGYLWEENHMDVNIWLTQE